MVCYTHLLALLMVVGAHGHSWVEEMSIIEAGDTIGQLGYPRGYG